MENTQNTQNSMTQNAGGSVMKQQTFRVTTQTIINLRNKADISHNSKDDVVKENLATIVKYTDQLHDAEDQFYNMMTEREEDRLDDFGEKFVAAIDNRRKLLYKILPAMHKEFFIDCHQLDDVTINMTPEENEQLETLSEEFEIPKDDVFAAVINFPI